MIEEYIELAGGIAGNFCKGRVPMSYKEDFISAAYLELILCLENYNPNTKMSLKNYIITTIKFRLIDLYRKEFGVYVSRDSRGSKRFDYAIKRDYTFNLGEIDEWDCYPNELSVNETEKKVTNKDLAFKLLDSVRPERRRQRVYKKYFNDNSNTKTAAEEGVNDSAVSLDIIAGLKQMEVRGRRIGK